MRLTDGGGTNGTCAACDHRRLDAALLTILTIMLCPQTRTLVPSAALETSTISFALKVLVVLAMAFPAFACSPAIHQDPPAYFLRARDASSVVFEGIVSQVAETRKADGTRSQRIVMRVRRQWLGPPATEWVVSGTITAGANMPCAGVFDFSASRGQEWLIFGRLEGDVVVPDVQASVESHHIRPATRKALRRLGALEEKPR